MKKQSIVYWIVTGLFSFWMLKNAWLYLTSEEAKRLCIHFGLPYYLRIELAIAKIIGVMVLLLPAAKVWMKEWAYAGFAITVVSGFIAHLASGDTLPVSLSAILALVLLIASYINYHRLNVSKAA